MRLSGRRGISEACASNHAAAPRTGGKAWAVPDARDVVMEKETKNMNGPREILTVKPPAKRFVANGRYMLSGNPRRGGIASVFRALDTQEERYVAVKVFRPVSGT